MWCPVFILSTLIVLWCPYGAHHLYRRCELSRKMKIFSRKMRTCRSGKSAPTRSLYSAARCFVACVETHSFYAHFSAFYDPFYEVPEPENFHGILPKLAGVKRALYARQGKLFLDHESRLRALRQLECPCQPGRHRGRVPAREPASTFANGAIHLSTADIHTVHSLEVDIIDMGPGGGSIVAAGTPEAVAAAPQSVTGKFLKEKL